MALELTEQEGVRLAVEGCGHGHLHDIYASVTEACAHKGWSSVDLLIIGGDFQAVRNAYDLNCVSMPEKYRRMADFHEYYSGQRTAPYLTLFVGGNHEASNYLFELYYGGWVAPNIYYMGAVNILRFGPLRIAGMSGIWKGYHYRRPRFERLPYNGTDMKSIYHVRELDVRKLLQVRTQVDIGISHDWPNGVEWKGEWKQLFRFKPHFRGDADSGKLGNVAAKEVMAWLRPRWWFSAHLHCKYAALVNHAETEGSSQQALLNGATDAVQAKNDDEIGLDDDVVAGVIGVKPTQNNTDEINLDMDSESGGVPFQKDENGSACMNTDEVDLEGNVDPGLPTHTAQETDVNGAQLPPRMEKANETSAPVLSMNEARDALPDAFRRRAAAPEPAVHPTENTNQTTSFLALDKCLPERHFLQLMQVSNESDVDSTRPLKLRYDPEWLAITRAFALEEPIVLGDPDAVIPRAKSQAEYKDLIDEQRRWVDDNLHDSDLDVFENFQIVAPVYDGGDWNLKQYRRIIEHPNPQTELFCDMLQIPNPFDISEKDRKQRLVQGPRHEPQGNRFGGRGGRGGFNRGDDRARGRGRGRGGGSRWH